MKLTRNHQSGAVILAIIVLIFLLIFLGYTLWQIWKMIRSIPSKPSHAEQVAGQMLSEFKSEHTNEPISTVVTQAVTISLVQPFDETNLTTRIWRSTNLINWEVIATNRSGETWTDTNAPWPNGFYWREVIR